MKLAPFMLFQKRQGRAMTGPFAIEPLTCCHAFTTIQAEDGGADRTRGVVA